jgi:Cdc6-like AAA superfamily ATPase
LAASILLVRTIPICCCCCCWHLLSASCEVESPPSLDPHSDQFVRSWFSHFSCRHRVAFDGMRCAAGQGRDPAEPSTSHLLGGGVGGGSPFCGTQGALRTLEAIAACVAGCEPCLLVGETGTGKTSSVQHLASLLEKQLLVVNVNQQTDASDLLGGYRPMEVGHSKKLPTSFLSCQNPCN